MATPTTDFDAALAFIAGVKLRDCYIADPAAPPMLQDTAQRARHIPYMSTGGVPEQCYVSGWPQIEGVMLLAPEQEFDADLRVVIAANNERALRDLLTAFPPGQTGFFYLNSSWMLGALEEFFEGQPLPAREGYFATAETLTPKQPQRARKLGPDDYPLVRQHWSESVWEEVMQGGYSVHACVEGEELQALCFQWPTPPHGHQVHGLQAVADYSSGCAEAVVSAATAEVVALGEVAFCNCNLDSDVEYNRTFFHAGYRPYYRVHSFLGIKRGTGQFKRVSPREFIYGESAPRRASASRSRQDEEALGEGHRVAAKTDPVLTHFRDLSQAEGRREYAQFVVEGRLLVERALSSGLPAQSILYTTELLQSLEGVELLSVARRLGIEHFQVSPGLLGRVTSTRPLPDVMAAIWTCVRDVGPGASIAASSLLIADNVQNPDNLGMIIRSADAAGIEGIIVVGEKSDPLHKNCVRAARGAVGRIPLFRSNAAAQYLHQLRTFSYRVVGATGSGERELYGCDLRPPVALVVGNEQNGIAPALLQACSERVRIPMAPGQDSLNVGVATGILIYESLRQRLAYGQ